MGDHGGVPPMTSPVREGDVLAGKYRVERVLGIGGMGIVVAATHLQLDQRVALKFLLPEALASKDIVERFAREARAAAKIESEHVARVIDVGVLESGSPYMVMEYLEGRDLSAVVEERGAVSVEEATTYVLQACEALAEAHAAGIVHRDLKPANLFLARRADKRSIVKVLDFGISKTPLSASQGEHKQMSLTKTAALLGSPLYMSPEQMESAKDVDARSDIWALGVILYELSTGKTPFNADTIVSLITEVLQKTPVVPSKLQAGIPPELDACVMRCLSKRPWERYANVAELAAALVKFAPKQRGSLGRIERILGAGDGKTAVASPSVSEPKALAATASAWGKTGPTGAKSSWVLRAAAATGAVGLLIGVGFGAVTYLRAQKGGARETPSSAPLSAVAPPPVSASPTQAPSANTNTPAPTGTPSANTAASKAAQKPLAVATPRTARPLVANSAAPIVAPVHVTPPSPSVAAPIPAPTKNPLEVHLK